MNKYMHIVLHRRHKGVNMGSFVTQRRCLCNSVDFFPLKPSLA